MSKLSSPSNKYGVAHILVAHSLVAQYYNHLGPLKNLIYYQQEKEYTLKMLRDIDAMVPMF